MKNWLTKEFFINLLRTDVKEWNKLTAKLTKIDLNGADLNDANLNHADLNHANLNGANLIHAKLDFSAWPLWCGSFDVKVDKKIAAQLIYHICKLDCNDAEFLKIRNNTDLIAFANEFHRVDECGEIEEVK